MNNLSIRHWTAPARILSLALLVQEPIGPKHYLETRGFAGDLADVRNRVEQILNRVETRRVISLTTSSVNSPATSRSGCLELS